MNKYNKSIREFENNITKRNTIIRSNEYDQKWTEMIYNKTNNKDYECIKHDDETNEINTSRGHVLFAGDTAIDYMEHQDMIKKLQTYSNEATKEIFKINWRK